MSETFIPTPAQKGEVVEPIEGPWQRIREVQSSDADVSKFVFEVEGDKPAVAESVLYRYPTYKDRTVICERDESIAAANIRQQQFATDFMEKMLEKGYGTRMFDPAGQDDIGGGCGQLWFVQDWMKNHPDQSKPSVGSGLPKVHTPMELVD